MPVTAVYVFFIGLGGIIVRVKIDSAYMNELNPLGKIFLFSLF